MGLSNDVLLQARSLIARRLGLDFPEGRQADLERGLLRASQTSPHSAPEAYLTWLVALPDEEPEWQRLAGHLTVGETYFYRDRACFEALEQQILPSLIAARRAEGILRLRLWSAGCATGEEPYSLAILVDRVLPDHSDWALTILATDINPEALDTARRGRYREWSFRGMPRGIRERNFHPRGAETFELNPQIRRMVTFAPLNLAENGYPDVMTNTTAMDLILCRNVLMYFAREAQRATVARLERALVPRGWLAVSPAEASFDLLRPLVPVNFPGAIFYRKESPAAIGHPPSAAVGGSDRGADLHSPISYPQPSAPASSTPRIAEPESTSSPFPQPPAHTPQPLLAQAQALADQGNLEAARDLCVEVLARDRLNPEGHLLLAAICQERGEIPAAVEALRRAIYLAPESAPAHFLLGSLHLRQGEHRRSRRSFETVVSLLSSAPRDEPVPGSDGMTAGRLLEMARDYLGIRGGGLGIGEGSSGTGVRESGGRSPTPRSQPPTPVVRADG